MINSSIFRTQEGEGITSCTKVIVGMIKKVLLVVTLLSVSSVACKLYAFEYPKFKCYTDRENEYLLGNVKKVVLSTDNDIVCEYSFNQQGNYSSISINKYTSSEYPFQKKFYRYFCEGCFVNNYFYNFFNVGLIYDDYHVPFWLGYLGARRNLSFSYDYNGKLTKIVTKEFGGSTDEYKFDYDNNGNPITRYCNGLPIMKFQWIGNNMSGFHIYNNEGRGIEEYSINCNNLTYKIINLRHKSQEAKIYLNNKGTVEKYEKFYDDSQTTVSCVYNSKGLLEKITNELKNRNEVTLITTSFVYDSYNNVLEHKEVKKTRHPSQTQWRTPSTEYIKYAYSYDKVGNWIKKVTYSVKQGDIEVKEKIATETRQITYYEGTSNNERASNPNGEVDEMPEFPGGLGALFNFLNDNINENVIEKDGGKGRAIATFMVESDGSITDIKVIKSIDPIIDKEFVRVLRKMPKWIPAKLNGSPVRAKFTVPLIIR